LIQSQWYVQLAKALNKKEWNKKVG
jgi:hypothetical protein